MFKNLFITILLITVNASALQIEKGSGLLFEECDDLIVPGKEPLVLHRSFSENGWRFNGQSRPMPMQNGDGSFIEVSYIAENQILCTASTGQSILYRFENDILVQAAETEFNYSEGKLVSELTDSVQTIYVFDDQNRVIEQKRGSDLFRFCYLEGATVEVDPLGGKTITRFNSEGLAVRLEEYGDRSTLYRVESYEWCGPFCTKRQVLDPKGFVLDTQEFKYDLEGRLIEKKEGMGSCVTTLFYEKDKLVKQLESNGLERHYFYDDQNLAGQITIKNGQQLQKESFTYDHLGRLTSSISEDEKQKAITDYYFDPPRIVEKVVIDGREELVRETRKVFDGQKLVKLQEYDCLGICTLEKRFDERGRLIEERGEDESLTTFAYDPLGRVIEKCTNGQKEYFQYDSLSRLVKKIDSYGNAIELEYDAFSRLVCITYPPFLGLNDEVIIPKEQMTYDLLNRKISQTDPGGNTTLFFYGSHGKLEKVVYPDATEEHYSYSECGELSLVKNRKGETVAVKPQEEKKDVNFTPYSMPEIEEETHSFEKIEPVQNSLGQWVEKKTTIYSDGSSLEVIKDALGRPFEVKKNGVLVKQFRYDASGNKVREGDVYWKFGPCRRLESVTINGKTTSYEYNRQGDLVVMTKPCGVKLFQTFDEKHRCVALYSSDHTVDYSFCFDDEGRIVEAVDNRTNSRTLRTYDQQGRLIEERLANNLTLKSLYDEDSNRISLTLPDERVINYTYENQKLKKISDGIQTFSYDKISSQEKHEEMSLISGLGTSFRKYDSQGRLLEISSDYQREILQRDSSGKIEQVEEKDYFHRYHYGAVNGVLREEGEFERDYQTSGSVKTLFDARGNLVQKGEVHFVYDALDRMIEAYQEGIFSAKYEYDPFNRRIRKTVHETLTYCYLWDRENEIGSMLNGKPYELRVLGLGHGAEIGATVWMELEGRAYQPLFNHRGDLLYLVDPATKEIVSEMSYTAFGMSRSSGKIHSPWRFCNKRVDEETGFVYFGKRYYSPELRHWTTPDPLAFYDGPHSLDFVQNDPVNRLDLHGLFSFSQLYLTPLCYMIKTVNFLKALSTTLRNQFDYEAYLKPKLEEVGRSILGRRYLHLGGFYSDKAADGYFGKHELSDKVRVTFINGILNARCDYKDSLEAFSKSHGGINIHYVFNPTDGWTWDLFKCCLAKFGFMTPQAKSLAKTWKKLIAEMGGVEGGGVIVHYCHSIGGTHTNLAASLMTEEELSMIHVISIGSATILQNERFGRVTNYVSKRDGVCMLDPIEWMKSVCGYNSHTQMIGSWLGIPMIDHPLILETYMHLIDRLGEKMLQEYL